MVCLKWPFGGLRLLVRGPFKWAYLPSSAGLLQGWKVHPKKPHIMNRTFPSEQSLSTALTVWTAGVKVFPLLKQLPTVRTTASKSEHSGGGALLNPKCSIMAHLIRLNLLSVVVIYIVKATRLKMCTQGVRLN